MSLRLSLSGSGQWGFFFSRRRRHTRWNCDWSSDVCSPDLERVAEIRLPPRLRREHGGFRQPARARRQFRRALDRSEERRVGKECRNQWWQSKEKKRVNI